jgi:hypothetical protein
VEQISLWAVGNFQGGHAGIAVRIRVLWAFLGYALDALICLEYPATLTRGTRIGIFDTLSIFVCCASGAIFSVCCGLANLA